MRAELVILAALAFPATAVAQGIEPPEPTEEADAPEPGPVAAYFTELASMGLLDADTGNKDTLAAELGAAEALLRDGAPIDAAVALYTIVESPRYEAFTDFVEYQNAEYYLGVSLANAGAFGAALEAFERVLRRGPDAQYWGPAHRRVVDIALETRDHAAVLARLEALSGPGAEGIPASASGERAYLRGRAAYDAGDYSGAEGELATISKKSRLYSSALYLRGVIKSRRGAFQDAAEAFCEIADQPDDDKFTFVVDDRYFTIKDLARLGLGRIAHEEEEYDDAYYHYFQIPEDSQRLPDALFEASWSMYQKRELATARDLVKEFLDSFPSSPLWPEADLLAGYVELADCKFDEARKWYEDVAQDLDPVVAELDAIRKDPDRRADLFEYAVVRWRGERNALLTEGEILAARKIPADVTERAVGLLQIDPEFMRLHDAINGIRAVAGEAPGVVKQWAGLAKRVKADKVGKISADSMEAADAADAHALAGDLAHLADQVADAREELARGKRAGTVPDDVAKDEDARLAELADRVADAGDRARAAADDADDAITEDAAPSLKPMLADDLAQARRLAKRAVMLRDRLEQAADTLAQARIDKLYTDIKRVADKARLGKIDAVIGQKQALDIQVQDFAQGRFPPELHGRLWDAGLIGDDEEVWPFEGEYWADEYEGWR